jgi:hypothetical protein
LRVPAHARLRALSPTSLVGTSTPPRSIALPMKDEKTIKRRLEELRAAFLTSDGTDPMHEKIGWIRALERVLGRT